MGNRLDTRLKKLEAKSPAEPMRIVLMWYGPTLPSQEEVDRINSEGNGRVQIRFQLYQAPELAGAGPKSAS